MNKQNQIIEYFKKNRKSIFGNTLIDFFDNTDKARDEFFADAPLPEITKKIVDNTIWLMHIFHPAFSSEPVGYYQDKSCMIYFDGSSILRFGSKNIQDLPFVVYCYNEKKDEQKLQDLKKYTEWCVKNDIPIDILNLHHDNNGNIVEDLTSFYNYEKENYYLLFPTKEDQELIEDE